MSSVFNKYNYPILDKLDNFEKFIRRQTMSRFLARYELFKKIQRVKGSIIECGVHRGGGLMAWAKLSSALEPYTIHRKIIGFDTFAGFVEISDEDKGNDENKQLMKGGFHSEDITYSELKDCIKEYDENRFLNQFQKVELIKGDALETIPTYLKNNQHLIISLLFMDFDLYKPTKMALECFLPRIPKGGIIVFDEINNSFWPGETMALMKEYSSLNNLKISKFEFDPNIAYIVL